MYVVSVPSKPPANFARANECQLGAARTRDISRRKVWMKCRYAGLDTPPPKSCSKHPQGPGPLNALQISGPPRPQLTPLSIRDLLMGATTALKSFAPPMQREYSICPLRSPLMRALTHPAAWRMAGWQRSHISCPEENLTRSLVGL